MPAGPTVPLVPTTPKGFQAFSRSCTITVGTWKSANVGAQRGLDAAFTVRRSLKAKEPNTCDLKLWNLSNASRQAIAQAAQKSNVIAAPPTGVPSIPGLPISIIPVQIDAGYVGHTSTIFLGEMSNGTTRSAQSVTDGPDSVLELNCGDGDTALALQRINASFQKGTAPIDVVQALLAKMGVGTGNLGAVKPIINSAQGSLFQAGVVLKGNAASHLIDICSGLGLEFSVQNGAAQFLSLGEPLAGQAYNLTPSSGLIGSPTVDTAGICSFVTLLLPGIAPGVPVAIDATFVQGDFRILSVEYEGDTAGNDWYCKCEAARIGVAP